MNSKKIKTLFVTSDSSSVAGVGPCLIDALENFSSDTIIPFVVCPWEKKDSLTISHRLQLLNCTIYTRNLGQWLVSPLEWGIFHLSNFFRTFKTRIWALVNLIENEGIDIVYSNGLPCIDAALAARLTHRPHIWHLHEAIKNNPDLKSYLPACIMVKLVSYLSDSIIVNSYFLENEFHSAKQL